MRSTSLFVRLSAITLLVAFLAFSLSAGTAYAGVAQATGTAAVFVAAGTAFAPCPPAAVAATGVATDNGIVGTPEAAATQGAATPVATANANPGFLGVRAEQVDSCGVRIVEVVPNSPASAAQLQADDVVVALDGVATPEIRGLRLGIEGHVPGDKVKLTIQRAGTQLDVTVTLGVKPADTTATLPAAPESAATALATQ